MEFDQILTEIKADIAGFVSKANEEIKTLGAANKETLERLDKLQKQADALDMKIARPAGGDAPKSLLDELKSCESLQRLAKDRSGRAILTFKGGLAELERKTTITSATVGSATSGVLNPERMPGIVMQAQKRIFVRDVLPSAPTSNNAVDYVKVNAFTSAASPQSEGVAKAEAALTFTTAAANVRTLAHWIPASKQVLDDMPGLELTIRNELVYGLKDKEELEILSGDNTGEHLNGLITQATSFTTGLLNAADGWEKADIIRRAIQQTETANETSPTWVALNPADWADIELAKDSTGRYIFGGPAAVLSPRLWGRTVIASNNVTSGTFLLGNSTGAMIRDREEITVEVSTEHANYFTENKVAIRCEERLALVVTRPGSFISGSLNTSPA